MHAPIVRSVAEISTFMMRILGATYPTAALSSQAYGVPKELRSHGVLVILRSFLRTRLPIAAHVYDRLERSGDKNFAIAPIGVDFDA